MPDQMPADIARLSDKTDDTLHTITVIDGLSLPAHVRDDLARLPQKADDLRDMLDLRIPF